LAEIAGQIAIFWQYTVKFQEFAPEKSGRYSLRM